MNLFIGIIAVSAAVIIASAAYAIGYTNGALMAHRKWRDAYDNGDL